MPDFRNSAIEVKKPGATLAGNVPTLGNFLREVMRENTHNFRVFGPDETQSNKLEALYEVGKKVWLGEYFPEDADGGELAPNGRVMEMLSEHTVEGWLEDLAEMYPERFSNKTNGVTPRRWLLMANPGLARIITDAIGEGWMTDLSQLSKLKPLAGDRALGDCFRRAKREAKSRFADWLK